MAEDRRRRRRGARKILNLLMHSRHPMQWVMSTEARAARVVDGLVGNRFVGITPPPLLPEKLRERPRVDAARVADVHDVAPRLGDAQHGPLVAGERGGRLLARRACRAVPAWKSNVGHPTPSTQYVPHRAALDASREVGLQSILALRAALTRRADVAPVIIFPSSVDDLRLRKRAQ